jgi:hypothetical protein
MKSLTINDVELLTAAECLAIRSVVCNLRDVWIQRHPSLPFYTLGIASYLDASQNNQEDYYNKSRQYNPVLQKHFGWLYDRLANALSKQLDGAVSYAENLALPGFHIFQAHQEFEQPIAAIHTDVNHQLFTWPSNQEIDFDRSLSFTLAIALPEFGGGLNLWDLSHEEIIERPPTEVKGLIESRTKSFHPYKLGSMVLHSGNIVHQIAPGKNLQTDDERITLQGHSLYSQGSWQLYW